MGLLLLGLLLTASVVFPSAFLTCAFLLRRWIQSRALRYRLATSLTSILQALMACTAGIYIVANCYQDFLYARCWLVDVYMSFGAPYMLYDIGAMYTAYHMDTQCKTNRKLPKKDTLLPFLRCKGLIIFHHILVGAIGFPLALFYRNGKGDFFLGCVFLTELSTPFVNLRVILSKLNKARSLLYQINNLTILVVYPLCHILVFPIAFWVYSWGGDFQWYQVPAHIPWHCTLGCLVLAGFQLFWYVKFIGIICKRRPPKMIDKNRNHPSGAVEVKLN